MQRILLLSLVALLPIMAACSSSDDQATENEYKQQQEDDAKVAAAARKKPLPICPQVAILRELGTFRDYGAEKPDPSMVVAAAQMQSIDGNCAYTDKDEDEGAGIDVQFDLAFIAERGPRLGGDHVDFPFFVAIVDPDGNIIGKNQLSTRFRFSDDIKKIENKTESLHVFVPLDKKDRDKGPGYRVLVGFQLTQGQLDIVKAREAAQMQLAPTSPALPQTPAAPASPSAAPAAESKPESPAPSPYPTEKGVQPYSADSVHFLKPPPGAVPEPESAPAQTAPESLQPSQPDTSAPDQPKPAPPPQ